MNTSTSTTAVPSIEAIPGFKTASLESLLQWAASGRPVSPWQSVREESGNIKRAPLTGGWKSASTDPAVITAWHAAYPDAIWGDCSPFDIVVDIDKKHGKDGDRSLIEADKQLTGGIVTTTASGGRHHRFLNRDRLPVATKNAYLQGVDIIT